MAGVWLAALWVPGVTFFASPSGALTLLDLALIAVILTAVNSLIRPVVKVLTILLYIITLGLFSIITNGLMFWLASWLSTQFRLPLVVDGFWPAVWGGLVTALVAWVVGGLLGLLIPKRPSVS